MKIQIIPCLKDNYSYLIIDEENNIACVVDPSEAEPIIEYLKNTQIKLKFMIDESVNCNSIKFHFNFLTSLISEIGKSMILSGNFAENLNFS